MQECRFDIKLLNIPIQRGGEVQGNTLRLKVSNRGVSIVEVKTRNLQKALGNETNFEANGVVEFITFKFKNRLAFHNATTGRHRRMRNKFVDTMLSNGLKFVKISLAPLLSMRRGLGFLPGMRVS
jgi:hypothetical protein